MAFHLWFLLFWLRWVQPTPMDFNTEITPRLTKLGCNSGACHGAAAGRGGLHLSLFGSDPDADFFALVQEFEGRRVNLAHPRQSLLMRKTAGEIDHGGGQRLDWDDHNGQALLRWLQAGAPRGSSPDLNQLQIKPGLQLQLAVDESVALQVVAQFADGREADVTPLVTWQNADASALSITGDSQLTALRPGQHFLLVRFLNQNVPVQVAAPRLGNPVSHKAEPRNGPIDDLILSTLEKLQLEIAPPASDHAWLRRVTLDLTGKLPNPEEVKRFVDSRAFDKREQCVDALLASEAYVDYWVWRWSKVFRMRSLPREEQGLATYSRWLREQIKNDVGWDRVARDLILSVGNTHTYGPANFHRMVNDPRAEAELVGQAFAGIRLECANCHDHPLDRWTQADYHGLAAIFAPLERQTVVGWSSRNRLTDPRTGESAAARVPGNSETVADDDSRGAVVEWLLDKEDKWLAKATVNRLWQAMLGRGLVDPVDDIRATNPASHPELLDWLAQDFANHGYRLKHTLRQIALSHTYARGSDSSTSDVLGIAFYSQYPARPLPPEIFADALSDFLRVPTVVNADQSTRAVQIIDGAQPLPEIDQIGRCRLAASCSNTENTEAGIAAALHVLNGSLINRRLMQQANQLDEWIEQKISTAEFIEQAFWRGLSRAPQPTEMAYWQSQLEHDSPKDKRELWEDFIWGLINSREFRENH